MVDEPQAAGTLSVVSPFSVDETLERLRSAIDAAGLTLFAEVDHSGGARAVGLEMDETRLLVFGNPRGGTPAMVAAPLLALELPLRALVRADQDGRTWVSYQDPAALARRFDVPEALMAPLGGVGRLVAGALGS